MSIPVTELRRKLLELDAAEDRGIQIRVEVLRSDVALVSGSTAVLIPGSLVGDLVMGEGIPSGTTIAVAGTTISDAATITGTRSLTVFRRITGLYEGNPVNPKVLQANPGKDTRYWEVAGLEASKPIYKVRIVWSSVLEPLVKLGAKWLIDEKPRKALAIVHSKTQNLYWEVLLA